MAQSNALTIEQEFIQTFAGSAAQYKRASQAIPSGITHDVRYMNPFPLYVTRASGSKKWDVDGHEIVDYAMGHGSLILGHSHPALLEAITEQIQRGTHYGAGHEIEIEWGERVCQIVPSVERVEFTSSGTEATLLAMRIARAFTGRDKIMKFAGHFHGWHDFAIPGEKPPFDSTSSPGVAQAAYDSVVVAPVNDLNFVDQRLAEGDVAAVILEPSGGSWASVPVPEGFLQRLREITRNRDTVLIFDEVITGFRWAPGGKQESSGVLPDLTTMAKIVAGGLPGGAVGGRADIMAVLEFRDEPGWKKVAHPGTYNANPLAAAAGSAGLALVADPGVQRHADAKALELRKGFNEALVHQSVPGFAWGESSVFHIMLGQNCENQTGGELHFPEGVPFETLKSGPSARISANLHMGMLLEGVDLFHAGGLLSAAHSSEDIEKTVSAFDRTIKRMQSDGFFEG